MRKGSFILICILIICVSSISRAQLRTDIIKPNEVDIRYVAEENGSTVSRDPDSPRNTLVLFLGGTGSNSASSYDSFRVHSVRLGYDFINLSYPNDVAAASLRNISDPLAFDHFRKEICFGTALSNAVRIDSLNSIYTRALKLIQYLDLTYPSEQWNQYLTNSEAINWSHIVVAGHSQGAGHASYLAKQFSVDRVIMFSGPNDYSDFLLVLLPG